MPWGKDSEEYQGWKDELLAAEDPYKFIQENLWDRDLADSRGDILDCFAGIMKEIGETGSQELVEKFRVVSDQLRALEAPDSVMLSHEFQVGDWNAYFRSTPEEAINRFEDAHFNPELSSAILESLTQIAENENLGLDEDRTQELQLRLAFLNAPDLQPEELQQDVPQQVPSQELGDGPQHDEREQGGQQQGLRGFEVDEDEISVRGPRQGMMLARDRGDLITEAIRDQVLKAQREVITEALAIRGVGFTELDTPEKFRNFSLDQANADLLANVFADSNVKAELDRRTIVGQQNVLQQFSDPNRDPHFSTIAWDSGGGAISANVVSKSQIVRDEDGRPLYPLKELTETFVPPKTVQDSQGNNVPVSKSRIVDMPKGDGSDLADDVTLHLQLVLKDANGNSPPKNKAVRFTAEYENGKLVEMSCPQPVKFTSNDPNAMGYIEHNGNIYTIPVTKEKYDSMMRTVAQNKCQSQAVNLSQNMDGSMMADRGGVDAQYERQEPYQQHQAQYRQGPQAYEAQVYQVEGVEGQGGKQQGGVEHHDYVPFVGPSQAEQNQHHLDAELFQPQPSQVDGSLQPQPSQGGDEQPPPPRPSVTTSLQKQQEIEALNAALGEGNLSQFLDRLQVNPDKTVTLKSLQAGEEGTVMKAAVVQEFLTTQRTLEQDNKIKGALPSLVTKFSNVEVEVGKSVRGEPLSPKTSVVAGASSMREKFAGGASVHNVSGPPHTPPGAKKNDGIQH